MPEMTVTEPIVQKTPEQQLDINEVLEKHHAKIKQVSDLSGDQQVEAFMDLISILPSDKRVVILLRDMLSDNIPVSGQIQVFEKLGLDPKKVEEHYKDLTVRKIDLEKRDAVADNKIQWIRNIVGLGTLAGLLALPKKVFSNNNGVKIILSSLGGGFAFVAANFFATRALTGSNFGADEFGLKPKGLRKESLQLSAESHDAFEREFTTALAMVMERRDRDNAVSGLNPPANEQQTPPAGGFAAGIPRHDNHVAQATQSVTQPPGAML